MPEPPRRKRFQIHLSTAIVLMFVAGALIWANTRVHKTHMVNSLFSFEGRKYGWPQDARFFTYQIATDQRGRQEFIEIDKWSPPSGVAIDVATALLTLLAAFFICERLRRRAARKVA